MKLWKRWLEMMTTCPWSWQGAEVGIPPHFLLKSVFMQKVESILCWNCRGASNKELLREIMELIGNYMPTIVVLLEPKINGLLATTVCRRLKKTHWVRSEVEGFSGGI